MPQHIVYKPAERPECEALVDGRWVPAEVRMWVQHEADIWTADVGYSIAPADNRIGTFAAHWLREVEAPAQGAGVDAP